MVGIDLKTDGCSHLQGSLSRRSCSGLLAPRCKQAFDHFQNNTLADK